MKWLRMLLLGCVLSGITGWSIATVPDAEAPDFVLKSHSGENLRLSELKGQVVMINFWASWCGPCRQEMPLLDALHRKYQKLGFTLLGVNVEKDTAAARRFISDVPVSFPVLFDQKNTVSRSFDVSGMPSTVVLDRDGRVRYQHAGYVPGDETRYSEVVRELLRQ
ncbi:MAG: TlpA disulfide reductase family protein [Pseudomonadota bacterium]|nr:TlpA disulfide reductase family protein [Pseudomonadota bacterium]